MAEHALNRRLELRLVRARPRLDAVRLREHCIVRVDIVRCDKAAVKEELLPDMHHLLPRVVEDEDLDRQLVLRHRAEVVERHVEGRVAVDQHHRRVRPRELRADGRGQAEAHRAERARRDDRARLRPAVKLRRHHLVIAHAGRDDDLLLERPLGEVVHGLDHLLRLDDAVGRLGVAERVRRLPRRALLEPRRARLLVQQRHERLHCEAAVALDRVRRLHDAPDLPALNIKMDNSAAPLALGLLGGRRVLGQNAGRPVVEARADGEDEVGVLDGVVGVRRAVHAEHVQRERMVLVEDAHRVERRRDGDVGCLRERAERRRAVDRALSDVEDRALGAVHQPRDVRQVGRIDRAARARD
mmetsp:Transcript_18425/g.57404  ORF Transcript_18425/g.57404 Transcript_18425/m.57404 type:complete len:356 (+) Transcript_18425:315-1382(+)